VLNARKLLVVLPAVVLGAAYVAGIAAFAADVADRPNVLFIAVDDLRPELGCYGNRLVRSPNIDRLAAQGVLFRRAYCQQAICSPSRASLLTGMRPDSLRVTDNVTYFRHTRPDVVTLPQYFRQYGYETVYAGKIFHGRMVDKENSWSRPATFPPRDKRFPPGSYQLPASRAIVEQQAKKMVAKYGRDIVGTGLIQGPVTEAADVPDHAYRDGRVAAAAVLTLRELKDRPFFLAVGFYKPHLPFVAPKKYWDLYDPADIRLTTVRRKPAYAPSIGLHASFELRTRFGVPKYGPIDDELARHLIHGYLACTSYVDAQVGKVLDELERLGLRKKTIIVLWGDHGWHLGEYGIWGKATNYEIATRVPLIVSPAGGRAEPAVCYRLVELLDIYPTLCEMAGLPVPPHVEGRSFARLVDDPTSPGKPWVLSQFPCPALREWAALPLSAEMRQTWFGPLIRDIEKRLAAESPHYSREFYEKHVMGYALRNNRFRMVLWVNVRDRFGPPLAVELYDHRTDPQETINVAGKAEYEETIGQLKDQLYDYWRKSAATCGATGKR